MTTIEKSWKQSGLLEGLSSKKRIIAARTLEECSKFLMNQVKVDFNGQADYFMFRAISKIIKSSDKKINIQELYDKIKVFAKEIENISIHSSEVEEDCLDSFCQEYIS
jgi:hypothetical protein